MPREMMAVRLDRGTRDRVARIARRRRQPASEVVREAIQAWVERQEGEARVADVIADLIGCVSGPRNLSAGGAPRVWARARGRRRLRR
jgi:Arc/MetJ-type ribon-helix-helix transcriptional regulator